MGRETREPNICGSFLLCLSLHSARGVADTGSAHLPRPAHSQRLQALTLPPCALSELHLPRPEVRLPP